MSLRRALTAVPLALLVCAAARAERVDVQPRWHVGDHVTYFMTEEITTGGASIDEVLGGKAVTVVLDVIEASRDGWLVTWREVPRPDRGSAATSDLSRARLEAAEVPMKLRLDVHGRLLEVVNWEQVRDRELRWAEARRRYMEARHDPPSSIASQMYLARRHVESEAAVRESYGDSPQALLVSVGHAYDSSAPFDEVVRDAPDPATGRVTPATQHFKLRVFDATSHLATLHVVQGTESSVMQERARTWKAATFPVAGAAASASMAPLLPDAGMTCDARVDVRSGWPRSVRIDKTSIRAAVLFVQTKAFERR